MTLSAGSRLGPYEILAPLGVGGMGEVYKARDVRLNRLLAIKVLRTEFSADPDRRRRFEREARAASALNHPSILSVYDVGREGATSYMAMEYVDGQTLRDLLRLGTLPVKKLLEIGTAMADGLSAAHEAGIVHRDIKPANVMVSRAGFIKIVDFGVAQMAPSESRSLDPDKSTASAPGARVGTVAYMSPEQALGGAVDFRSDQFAFGSVLYEMATGRRAFRGETDSDLLAAIVRQEPEAIGQAAPDVPAPFRWIVDRCLSKAPADRYASTIDLARELRNLKERVSEISGGPLPPGEVAKRRWAPVAAAVGALAVAALFWTVARPPGATPEVDFRRLTLREGTVYRALFVPRSNAILYTASWDGGPARSYLTLPESKGVDRSLDAEAQLPMAYTEDGSEALVMLGRSRPGMNAFGRLAWWPALGGKPRVVMDEGGWADVARRARFMAVVRQEGSERTLGIWDAAGKRRRTLFRTTGSISYVRISPDETEVAFFHHPSRLDDAGEVRIAPVNGSSEARAVSPRFERCAGLAWSPRGDVWFTASRESLYRTSLWATDRSARIRTLYSFPEFFILSDISETGQLLLVSSSGGMTLQLVTPGAPPRDYTWLGFTFVADVAPDGKSVLFMDGGATGRNSGLWVRPLNGDDASRLTDGDPGKFSPDGKWVVTTSQTISGPSQLVLVPAAGGDARPVTSSAATHTEPSFLDSHTLLFVQSEGDRREVWRIDTDGTGARSLGAPGCGSPVADPTGRTFLCVGGATRNAISIHPVDGGAARPIIALPLGVMFLYARWDTSGKEILAVTNDRRFLTLSPASGKILRTETVPQGPAGGTLLSAAFSADAKIRAYSTSYVSSRLYLCRGL